MLYANKIHLDWLKRSNSLLDGQNKKLMIDRIANEHVHIVNNSWFRERKRASIQ